MDPGHLESSGKRTVLGQSKMLKKKFSQQKNFYSHKILLHFRIFFLFQGLIRNIKNSKIFHKV